MTRRIERTGKRVLIAMGVMLLAILIGELVKHL